jgi:enoyl-[acyl-carrier protein] reductase II
MGSRFVCSNEASSHINFKEAIIKTTEGDTQLTLRKVVPVRMIKKQILPAGAGSGKYRCHAGRINSAACNGRAKRGMFEGNLDEGELEIGQVSAIIERY